jgi:hypothetical protein
LTHAAPPNATRDESTTSPSATATTVLLGPPSLLFRSLTLSDWQLSAGASRMFPRSIAELALRAPHTLDRFARYVAAVNLSLALLNSAPLFLLDGAVAVRPLVAMFACLLACACAWAKQTLARRGGGSGSRGGTPTAAPVGSPMRGIVVVGSSSAYASISSSSVAISASATAASAASAAHAHASAANAVHRSLIELLENPLKRIARDAIVSQHAASIERLPRAARYHALWLGMCSDERVRNVAHRVLQAGSLMAALHVGAATAEAVWGS